MRGICANHDCPMFERPVSVSSVVYDAERARCEHCGQLLVHATGLTFRDHAAAVAQGDDS